MSEKCCDDWGQCFEPVDFPEEFAPVVQTARLENWAPWGDGLRGEVYGHPNFPDGKYVFTSNVWELDEAAGICRTRNTLYTLGKKA